jgi:hypothetical protein
MSTQSDDPDDGERARLLAISIAGRIACHCPSARAGHYAASAIAAVGALATRDSVGNVDAVAVAGQHVEELLSVSSVCPTRHLCGVQPLSAELSALLSDLQH